MKLSLVRNILLITSIIVTATMLVARPGGAASAKSSTPPNVEGLSFFGGVAHPAWSDNSNSTGTNPDGALHKLDIYTAAVRVSR